MKPLPSLKQLQYLSALAQTRHFGKAAELCHITPSTLSAGIRELETLLGLPLAERTKRRVRMTAAGLEIAARAQVLLRDAEDIVALSASQRAPLTGELWLGLIPTISPFFLPRVLPQLRRTHPELRLYLREEQTTRLLRHLDDGEIDLALIALPYDIGTLSQQVLFGDGFCFACARNHPLAERSAITTAEIADQPLMLLEEGHCLHQHALEICQRPGAPLRRQFEATSLFTMVQMVAAGLGVTLLPQLAIDGGVTRGTDICLIPLATPAARQIGLVWRPSSPRTAEFQLLAEVFTRQAEPAAA